MHDHLEEQLRLFDPTTGTWLPTPQERAVQAEAGQQQAQLALAETETENQRLRQQIEELRRRPTNGA